MSFCCTMRRFLAKGRVSRNRTNTVGGLMARSSSGLGVANSQVAVKVRVGYALIFLNRSELDFRSSWPAATPRA